MARNITLCLRDAVGPRIDVLCCKGIGWVAIYEIGLVILSAVFAGSRSDVLDERSPDELFIDIDRESLYLMVSTPDDDVGVTRNS